MKPRQLSFLPKPVLHHGGQHSTGRRKTARPIDTQRGMHLTLKSSRARGERSLLRRVYRSRVEGIVREVAEKRSIRLYRYVNVGNHLHLVVKTRTRRDFQNFLREVTGKIAVLVTGATKANPFGKFWDNLAWSRVVHWGRDFAGLHLYVIKNIFEAHGLYTKHDRENGRRVICIRGGPPEPPPSGAPV